MDIFLYFIISPYFPYWFTFLFVNIPSQVCTSVCWKVWNFYEFLSELQPFFKTHVFSLIVCAFYNIWTVSGIKNSNPIIFDPFDRILKSLIKFNESRIHRNQQLKIVFHHQFVRWKFTVVYFMFSLLINTIQRDENLNQHTHCT